MRLQKIQVTNFRSVNDSGEFDVDSVTCLVGKNEAGKSAILLALAALNPNEATPVTIDKERDYPRRNLVKYRQIHPDDDAVVVQTTWRLDEGDIQTIAEEVGEEALTCQCVEVSRRYGSDVEVAVSLDSAAIVRHYLDRFALDESERSVLNAPDTTEGLIEALDQLSSSTEKHEQLKQYLSNNGDPKSRVQDCLVRALPSFMYVSSYDRMDGAIQIENTQSLIQNNTLDHEQHRGSRLFVDFLAYAGVPLDEIVKEPTYETFNAKLQAASTNITDQILEYWSQNPDLDVEVKIDNARPGDRAPFNTGTIARARIKNNLHRVDTPFSERSAGFVWFFSFLVKFARVKEANQPVVLLLDEPGLSLHGKAQGDLLRFIDKELASSHQVIYSTHSPFMVSADNLERVRVVEDRIVKTNGRRKSHGTKVGQDVLEVEADTLFPLQGALGYEATQSLFVGKHTLLVEGPSDILYLQALSSELGRRGRTKLDPRWTLCPAGGIDKVMSFISLFAGNDLHVAVLTDYAHGSKGKIGKITKSDILRADHCYTFADFVDAPEADVEDVFAPQVYADIVNNSFDLPKSHRVTSEQLGEEKGTTRVVKKVEAMFRTMPATMPEFDHFTPAAWLIRNPGMLGGDSDEVSRTLAVAEKIFRTVNGLVE